MVYERAVACKASYTVFTYVSVERYHAGYIRAGKSRPTHVNSIDFLRRFDFSRQSSPPWMHTGFFESGTGAAAPYGCGSVRMGWSASGSCVDRIGTSGDRLYFFQLRTGCIILYGLNARD